MHYELYYLELGVGGKCSIATASEYSPDSILIQNARIIKGNLNHVILTAARRESDQVLSILKGDFRSYETTIFKGNMFVDSYKIGHGMLKAVMNQDVFMLFPIIARNGIENFRLVSRFRSDLENIVDKVGRENLVERQIIDKVSVSDIISGNLLHNASPSLYGLTDREIETLKVAINSGYYEWPRKNGLEEISMGNGASKVTTLYHIRNAEKKIMETLFRKNAR
jgi:hypothetical protein